MLSENPQTFDGKAIEIDAHQERLKKNEWGLSGDTCLPIVLLVLPGDVITAPQFTLEDTPAFKELLAARGERVSFNATFVARFDWSGPTKKGVFWKNHGTKLGWSWNSVSNPKKVILP